jgi:SMODS and SLOG-associating 2TM effector domain 2
MRRTAESRAADPAGEKSPVTTSRRRAKGRRPDLSVRLIPLIGPEQWREPREVLSMLYAEAQAQAVEIYEWYMADRISRKFVSRILRGLALVLASAGGLVPLANVAAGQSVSGLGYVLLALAGVCFGFDRFLGLSAGWMRDVMTAQQVQRRLQEFQFSWLEMNAADAREDPPETVPEPYLKLLHEFVCDLSDLVLGETGEWVSEFQSGLQQLESVTSKK